MMVGGAGVAVAGVAPALHGPAGPQLVSVTASASASQISAPTGVTLRASLMPPRSVFVREDRGSSAAGSPASGLRLRPSSHGEIACHPPDTPACSPLPRRARG